MTPSACVFTHRSGAVVGDDAARLVAYADDYGVELRAAPGEADKHPSLAPAEQRGRELGWPQAVRTADYAMVLAGDGTLLRILNELRDGPPVLGVNYGVLGFLSAVSRVDLEAAVRAIARDELDTMRLGMLHARLPSGEAVTAMNDVVATGGGSGHVVQVAWRIACPLARGGERVDEMGVVRCDGMVISTPTGSTAYNLSNGGPVMAWGVKGFVISFIAPHTLAARPLVIAPQHEVELEHLGRGVPLSIFADGAQIATIRPGERLRVGFEASTARLAFVTGPSFYERYRDTFTRQGSIHTARGSLEV